MLIPTAGARYGSHDGWTAIEELQKAGVEKLEILHTRSRSVADLAAFAAPLKEATGVWFSGGRQFRLVDVYLETETHAELQAVLDRGGVVGGNSAGASASCSRNCATAFRRSASSPHAFSRNATRSSPVSFRASVKISAARRYRSAFTARFRPAAH